MRRIIPWLCATLLAPGCGDAAPPQSSPPEPLRVAAASDLQAVMPELIAAFKQGRGGDVEFTAGSSGQLAQQLRQGAPFDVFLAANRKFVDDLASEKVVRPDSVRPYAVGTLVLAVHEASADAVRGLADLAKPEIKHVALANPEIAPYGLAGKQALERAGLWEAVKPKLAQAETVRQALHFVESGNAEAGLVGKAIASVPGVKVVEIEPTLYEPIVQGLGVVAGSKRPDEAEAFARFVLGNSGQAVLARFGFRKP